MLVAPGTYCRYQGPSVNRSWAPGFTALPVCAPDGSFCSTGCSNPPAALRTTEAVVHLCLLRTPPDTCIQNSLRPSLLKLYNLIITS